MNQKRALKIILWIWVAVIVSTVAIVGLIFFALPSPQKVAKLLGSKSQETASVSAATPQAQTGLSETPPRGTPASPADASASPAQSSGTPSTPVKKPGNQIVEDRYIDQTRPVTPEEICRSLQIPSKSITSAEDFSEEMGKLESGELAASAAVESVLLPVGFIMKMDSVRDVMEVANEARTKGESDFKDKAWFYAKVASAMTEIYTRSEELNRVADVGYYLYVLSKLTDKAPGLRSSAEMASLCEEMVSAPPQSEQEQKELASTVSKLIRESGLQDQDLGFNPEYRTKVQVKTTKNSLEVGMGWLNEVLKPKSTTNPTPDSKAM